MGRREGFSVTREEIRGMCISLNETRERSVGQDEVMFISVMGGC